MKYKILLTAGLIAISILGCQHKKGKLYGGPNVGGPQHDRPFPLGQVSDSFWETQETNAEAADFIFHDHEFVGNTQKLTPAAKHHLEQVAIRLEHTPFPIVIEQSENNCNPQLDIARRKHIVENLARMGVTNIENRVVISNSFPEGYTGVEAERAYGNGILSSNRNNAGRGSYR